MKTPLIYLSLLSVSCAFCTLTYTPNSHAKNIQPTTHIGTWQNKDEDGDGVPDEQDDYPFDASKTQYPVYFEKEPNDNPSVATPVELGKGFKVKGVISSRTDKGDLYGFNVDDGTMVTAVFESAAKRFDPQVYVSNSEGRVISKYVISEYKKFGKHIVNFHMFEAGRYQLSVMDNNYGGGPDLTYSMVLFYDEDVDAFDDEKERAFGSNLIKNDQDQDDILDGLEYVLLNNYTDIDFDEDGIPNWQDTDSDDDSFSDKIEGIADLNSDRFPNYIDRDADGNTIDDKLESGDFNNPNDFDDDGKIDHLDLDDDNDGIFDINDFNRLEKAERFVSSESGSFSPSWIYNLISTDSNQIRSFVRVGDTSELEVVGLPDSADNLVIVYYVNGLAFNSIPRINRKDGNSTYLSLDLPSLKGTGYLQVAYDEIISEELPIEIFDSSNPIITSDLQSFSPGQTITINGENFDSDTTVFFSGTAVKPTISNDSEIVVEIPNQVSSGRYWVVNEAGKSNSINYTLQTNLTFAVAESAAKPIAAVGGIFPSFAEPANANKVAFTKVSSSAEVIYSFTLNDKGELESYLSAVLPKNTTEIEFSYASTAVSAMASHLTFFYEAEQISLEEVASIIEKSERFPAFLQEVTTALEQDSGFFSYLNSRKASQQLLESYASYFKEQIIKSKQIVNGKNRPCNKICVTAYH